MERAYGRPSGRSPSGVEFRDRFDPRSSSVTPRPDHGAVLLTPSHVDRPGSRRHAARPSRGGWAAGGALAGAVAAGAALAAGELVCGDRSRSRPSPVTAVGTEFIDRFAASLKDLAVDLFGTNDKPALVTGIVIVVAPARRRARDGRPAAAGSSRPLGFAAFGAGRRVGDRHRPAGLASAMRSSSASVVGVVAGIGDVRPAVAARRAARRDPVGRGAGEPATADEHGQAAPDRRRPSRRSWSASAGVGSCSPARRRRRSRPAQCASGDSVDAAAAHDRAAAADALGAPRRRRSRSRSTASRRTSRRTATSTASTPRCWSPRSTSSGWSLSITGLVDHPFSHHLRRAAGDGQRRGDGHAASACPTRSAATSSATPSGRACRSPRCSSAPACRTAPTQIVGRSVDGFTAGFPTGWPRDGRTALVAYAMNGEPLPARSRLPGAAGRGRALRLRVGDEVAERDRADHLGRLRRLLDPARLVEGRPDQDRSRASTCPTSARRLAAGTVSRSPGSRWAPEPGHRQGRGAGRRAATGTSASSARSLASDTWVQWYYAWDATPGEHTLRVRATDSTGALQIEQPSRPDPNGATGYHSRSVTVGG